MKKDELNDWLVFAANVGVLIGLLLLVLEIRQNSELMRAEVHMMRAEGKANRQMDMANNGVFQTIHAKLADAGFPGNRDALDSLTTEERFRLQVGYVAIIEVTVNWFIQCQHGLLLDETCDRPQRRQVLWVVPRARAIGIGLGFTPSSFIAEVQRIFREEGLTPPNDDGSWPAEEP